RRVRALSRRTGPLGAKLHPVARRRRAVARDRLYAADRANVAQQFPRRTALHARSSNSGHLGKAVKRILGVLAVILCATTSRANVVDLAPQRGRALPPIKWTDESGRARQLSEFSGYPLILLPIYTRCPGPCLQTVARLKDALADSAN